MYKTTRTVGFLALLFLLAGCTAGKDFIRPTSDTFQLGRTSYSQVIQKMGEPKETSDVVKNEKLVKSITYEYVASSVISETSEKGVIAMRALTYSFYNDTLVGQEFFSTFKSDNSNFDNTKVERIKKGQTTRAEVIQMLGKPTASLIPPMVKATSGEAFGYNYKTIGGNLINGLKVFTKTLLISFDDKDFVSDVEYTSSSTK